MFFFIPIRTEKDTQSLPNITIGLIALNLIIWIFTNTVVSRQIRDLTAIHERLMEIEIPYLMDRIQDNPDLLQAGSPDAVHEYVLKERLIPEHHDVYEE